jgi:cation diffusion facilitator family transporter
MVRAGRKAPWVDPLSAWMLRRLEQRVAEAGSPRRTAFGIFEGWIGLFLNAILFAIKLFLGLSIGSVALIADAIHTLADSITSAVLIIGSHLAKRPADVEHPYGHGRIELVAAMIIAVLLGIAGIEFLKSSIERIAEPTAISASWLVAGIVFALAIIKEWNARFATALARACGSTAIEADAWHHRSDVFATLLVAIGIVGSKYGVHILDGIMGVLVSVVILLTALMLARESTDELIGTAPTPEDVKEVADQATSVAGVRGVHDIIIHNYGDVRLVSLHVETEADESPLHLHSLAETVQDLISKGRKGHVVVHIDPVDRNHPRYDEIRAVVKEVVARDERVQSFHDMRVVGEAEHTNLIIDIVVAPDGGDAEQIKREVAEHIRAAANIAKVVAHIEPLFAYDGRGKD